MLKSAYEGLNARPKVYLSKEYFCEMYPTCVSSKLCEFFMMKQRLRPEFRIGSGQCMICDHWCYLAT